MNFKADDYLAHHGVKGMRWRKHKYKLVKGSDGKYHYIYDDAQTAVKSNKNSKAINDQKSAAILRKEADKARKTLNDNSYYLGGTRDKNGKFSGEIAKNETARRSAAANKKDAQKASYPSSVKRTQEAAAEKRKTADSWRLADPRVESVEFYKDIIPGTGAVPKRIYRKGAYSFIRSGKRVTPSKETKKRLRRNKRKKTVADVKRFINGLVNRK